MKPRPGMIRIWIEDTIGLLCLIALIAAGLIGTAAHQPVQSPHAHLEISE